MKLLSKNIFLLSSIIVFTGGCFLVQQEEEKGGFTPEAQVFVDRILAENGTKEYSVGIQTVGVDGGMSGEHPTGYVLNVKVNSVIVLTSTVESLSVHGIYKENKRLYYGAGPGMAELPFMGICVKCDTLDSIRIVTDSTLKMPGLGLGSCNLTYLPPLIGKLRVNALDLNNNHIKDLPLEVMSIFDYLPKDSGKINVSDNPISQDYWGSVPDTLKTWLRKHAPI